MQNPYHQAFCSLEHFQWDLPCGPTDLVYFRKRIGGAGVEKIFQASVALHAEASLEREVVIDTTVQEKNITFLTNTKLRVKVMNRCWKPADEENLTLRVIRFGNKSADRKKVPAAIRGGLKQWSTPCCVISCASSLKTV